MANSLTKPGPLKRIHGNLSLPHCSLISGEMQTIENRILGWFVCLGSSVQKLGKREILPRQRKFVLLNSMPCLLSSCPHYFAPNHFASHFSTPIFLLCYPRTLCVSLRLC